MFALECADLQDIASGRLASQSDKPTGPNILPPFSGIFFVDFKQILSNEDFKQAIYDFFKEINHDPPQPAHSKAPFPTPHLLAQFASTAYTDYKTLSMRHG
jgi:hypothetical protein